MPRRKRLLKLLTLAVLTVILAEITILISNYHQKKPQHYNVILKANGFSPQSIAVHQGDTVTFSTDRDRPFWVASNPHPTHTIYPEFDSGTPINANSSWSFTFDKNGTWQYHDHLFPSFLGTIIVLDNQNQRVDLCSGNQNNPYCWQKELDDTFSNHGIDQALSTFSKLYRTQNAFASDCHGYAHILGEEAFRLYSHHTYIPLTDVTTYCGYGFYHGFMQSLLGLTPDPKVALSFCDSHIKNISPLIWGACYHGIGHGAFSVVAEDPANWGKPQVIIDKALDLCQKVSSEPTRLDKCGSGVYMELATSTVNSLYGLKLNLSDPISICRTQKDINKPNCYAQSNGLLNRYSGGNFAKGAQWIETIREDAAAQSAIEWLALTVRISKGQVTKQDTAICRSLQERLHLICIKGLAVGIALYGSPGHESEEAHQYCHSSYLTNDERNFCDTSITMHDDLTLPSTVLKERCSQGYFTENFCNTGSVAQTINTL